ncbi:uncharacterized protein N7482_006072 [Penicillium canariense]|uniref:Uncharacterized protein n=1 Tax=Penicillium canariense TaxID=189055 RepID=A0A9W9LNL8_9EURO|nr:uncharacterized protein N7482_006072 [Penicillium canariense]KAJ5167291.1 hypothetical protein N7482_006072 [Penicillium canariense]
MGQRHNRRRTRPRSSNRRNSINQDAAPTTTIVTPGSPLAVPSTIWTPQTPPSPPAAIYHTPSAACISPGSPVAAAPALIWHYGYTAWQIRESAQRLEAGTDLEGQQYRLCGGEPGDDLSLCDRMLEYFGGLDYIDA